MKHPRGRYLGKIQRGQIHRNRERDEQTVDSALLRGGVQLVGGSRLTQLEGAAPGPAKRREVGTAAQSLAQVGRQGAHVGAGRALDADLDVGWREVPHLELVDSHRLRGALYDLAAPGEPVEGHSTLLDRAEHRRNLLDLPLEFGQSLDQRRLVGQRTCVPREDATLGVERVGLDAEPHGAQIDLLAALHEGHELGAFADGERQHPGRLRVERPEMPHPTRAEPAASRVYHVV